MFSYRLERKETFEDDKNDNFLKSKKWVFSMVSVKKSAIFSSVFLSKIGLEIMFSYLLERKETFEDDKNDNFFKSKKWVFSKEFHPWFWFKNLEFFLEHFSAK